MIAILRRTIVVALLAAWSFPATGLARTNDATAAQAAPARGLIEAAESAAPGAGATAPATGSSRYAEREKQSRGLEDFQGNGSYIYIGGGALTVVLVVLLILLIL